MGAWGQNGAMIGAAPQAVRRAGGVNIAAFVLLSALALALVVATPIPAMLDYSNHLARMYILADDSAGRHSLYYQVNWAFYPNLAVDLIVPRLARFVDVQLAMRLFFAGAQVLLVSGAVALEFAVKRRFETSGYFALLFLNSLPFAWGFLNFEFSMAVALWGFALWLILRSRPWPFRLAVHSVCVAALFLSHMIGLGIYGFALGMHELWLARRNRTPLARLAAEAGLLAAPALAGGLAMALLGGSVGDSGNLWGFFLKPLWPLFALNGYSMALSIASVGVLSALLFVLRNAQALRFESSGAWLSAGFALLYVVFPMRLLGTNFDDVRIIVAAALILPAFVSVIFPNAKWRWASSAVMMGLILANLGFTAAVWTSYRDDYREMAASFGKIGQGSKILIASVNAADPMRNLDLLPMFHAPILAIHHAGALAPTLFTTRGKQPVNMRPPYERFSSEEGGPVDMADLKAIADFGPRAAASDDYVREWRRDFDYLYFIGAPTPNPMPQYLDELQTSRRFTLYRIRKPDAP
ncbi:hypothetical protein QM467_07335 [Rhodoblastus sp. 17X3]|uniref:hypothetical protein n=1 Tax=Rhodoblastus sp. 17X3 TaxID=3047026 RepID=UPI0024B6C1AD|nr:hypothetical protein [Rhodoblastus sp. 17X3]MDI9847864.1 hypothetical protein [Rhodoblastus sp. 17X3]